ncbi:GntR family transcriptional regulator [Nocardioidaceae bacterium SCSIO 66511]|nr:GntR family transcriptional regulator [Nocardioidaceae bacterium SCSIO 66511]
MTPQTLSQKVAEDLRAQIAEGRLKVGAPIPSQAQLTERYEVSTSVTRKAVDQLRGEGLLVGQPGKAVYVQATPREVEEETRHVDSLATRLTSLEDEVRGLAPKAGASPDLSVIEELRGELTYLRRQVAVLRSHLMDLYGRMGQPYPHDEVHADEMESAERATGTS